MLDIKKITFYVLLSMNAKTRKKYIFVFFFLFSCGKCRRYMKLIQAKPSRLHCSNCDETYSLPQNGGIKLYQELKCPLDDYELVLWTTGTKGKVINISFF